MMEFPWGALKFIGAIALVVWGMVNFEGKPRNYSQGILGGFAIIKKIVTNK